MESRRPTGLVRSRAAWRRSSRALGVRWTDTNAWLSAFMIPSIAQCDSCSAIVRYTGAVSRYRLYPSGEQEQILLEHCGHARFIWNLGQEQRSAYRPGRGPTPGFAAQCRQLTEARAAEPWLAAGPVNVQQQALRDLDQAWRNFFNGTHQRPGWRKQHIHEGFRITDTCKVTRLNRNWGQVAVPKVGWVRFKWSRDAQGAKSYRVTRDRAGRWHVAFAVIPQPIAGPGTGDIVGIDRGVVVTAALSTGEHLHCPALGTSERARLRKAQRRAARAPRQSPEKAAEYARVARLRARGADIRKDWVEKASTDLARRFDVIRFEDLRIRNMTTRPAPKPDPDQPGAWLPNGAAAKAGLNRAILAQGWGMLVTRTTDKAPGRVQKVRAAYTSLRCSDCGWIDKDSRKSQAEFLCANCGFTCNADQNASINIAAGRAGGTTRGNPVSVREPLAGAA